jgi:hypothetical protein
MLSALRRVGADVELRLVAEHPSPGPARIEGAFTSALEVDLLGRSLDELRVSDPGTLVLPVGPWEIRTIRLGTGRS